MVTPQAKDHHLDLPPVITHNSSKKRPEISDLVHNTNVIDFTSALSVTFIFVIHHPFTLDIQNM